MKYEFKWCGGAYAVITGATEGLGVEYSLQLAQKGYNLLLISQHSTKLTQLVNEIQRKHASCRVRTLAIDLRQTNIDHQINYHFRQLPEIHVLVNNAGIYYPMRKPKYFERILNLDDFINDIINVNVKACTKLTALVLPQMVVRGRGVIINVSSFAAILPVPLLSLYSATKAYVDSMSRALHEEYKDKGIVIQSVLPFYTATNHIRNNWFTYWVPNKEECVRNALSAIGSESR
ncbi:unnamed protein product, partial [Medioppia subpectinata]